MNQIVAVQFIKGFGRGVVALRNIEPGEVLSVDPVLPVDYAQIEFTALAEYSMEWIGRDCIACGPSQFLNHSETPNVTLVNDEKELTKTIVAVRPITEGEQLFIDYDVPLWFEPVTSGVEKC